MLNSGITSTLRQTEFSRIIDQDQVYVDYTGGGQCPASVLQKYGKLLLHTTFGNPHSANPTSLHTTQLISAVRSRVLQFFNAQDDYELIFTANATGAMKILGESQPWDRNTVLILSRDNHNSVLGTREYAKRAGATVVYWELDNILRLERNLTNMIHSFPGKKVIVAFPAQSNFSGVIHPVEYVAQAQQLGATVWLDTAAYVPSHPLNLQRVTPDAICVSFYKILGFPTGLGALIIRKALLQQLRKAWFAGGTVRGVSLSDYVLESGYESFEDGTVNYALIPALHYVFDFIEQLGGVRVIEQHVQTLTAQALVALCQMERVVIYGPTTMEQHGGTIAFNILDHHNQPIHFSIIEQLACEQNISLRGGCFCNPGSGSRAFGLDSTAMQHYLQLLETKTKSEAQLPGAVRISFGIANDATDVERTIQFVRSVVQKYN